MKKQNLPSKYEPCKLGYTLSLTYTPDWSLLLDGGKIVYLEAKGLLDYETRRKMSQVKKEHPDLDIRIVFMRNQKIRKNSNTTYMDWAEKNGFPCSVYPELPL